MSIFVEKIDISGEYGNMYNKELPYNDLPLLPPKIELETKTVLKLAISTHRALAALKASGELIPNQSILIHAIGLQEAKISSEIENIVTTNDELYCALADEGEVTNFQTKEVLGYRDALWYGYHQISEKKRLLTTLLYEEILNKILLKSSGIRKLPGTVLKNGLGKVIYTPPNGEGNIRNKLSNLESFLYKKDRLDELVKLAVMHYQFEAIHPFYDGNGRTGRILNILYLVDQGYLDLPVLYLSHYINENKKEYYKRLRLVTEAGDWEPWIVYMLEAIEQTARLTENRIKTIATLMDETAKELKEKLPKIYSKDLVEVLFQNPYSKISMLEKAGIAKRQTASRYLQEMEAIQILTSMQRGREKYFVNTKLMTLLKGPL